MKFQAILKIVKRNQEIGGNTKSGTGSGTGSYIDRKSLNYHQIIPKVCSPSQSLSPLLSLDTDPCNCDQAREYESEI